MTTGRLAAFVLAAALSSAGCASGGPSIFADLREQPTPSAAAAPAAIVVRGEPIVRVVDRVAPAVVNVRTDVPENVGRNDRVPEGTGFIVDESGVVVTNFHVIEQATVNIRVTTAEGESFDATVIGSDADADIAVLTVEADDALPTVELGDSENARLGQRVVALGFALGLEGGPSVTSGILSAKDRSIEARDPAVGVRQYEDLLQTDAAINPGNSGGPLVDMSGRVIGINTAGVGAASAENIGFAIAIDRASPLIERAIENPAAPLAYLGVQTRDVDPVVQAQLGLASDSGALILEVVEGEPAERAGLTAGDIIVSFAGDPVDGSESLQEEILSHSPGDAVEVGVVRPDGDTETVEVTLGERLVPPIEG
ncbi:MAG TPA: trypsin-like peptidase domain-containing protein [Actinomycetota bacterium]|nr:trypsin-like peptidase domain-containing protein [Actinomycetota bacterium]